MEAGEKEGNQVSGGTWADHACYYPPMSSWPPSTDEILELPTDELAIRLLDRLAKGQGNAIHRGNLTPSNSALNLGIHDRSPIVWRAVGEAYDWLLYHGLIANNPGRDNPDFAYVSKRGKQLLEESCPLSAIKATKRLDLDLHPLIARRVRSQFILGEYKSAVLLAFREVEIRVRDLGGFDNSQVGVPLMQQAFSPNGGPLLDDTLEGGEQQATMFLFAGAIGAFKNPSSHRQVDYGDATVAAEAVLLAGLLLRILDRYKAKGTA